MPSNICGHNVWLPRISFYYQNKIGYTIICLSYLFIKTRKYDKNMAILDIKIHTATTYIIKKQFYQIMR